MSNKIIYLETKANHLDLTNHQSFEFCILGRSNVGKSSLINLISNNKIAKTSQTPGKTQTLNLFYNNVSNYYICDLPGYGYAKLSKEKLSQINKMCVDYLYQRKQLKLSILLIDSRRGVTDLDRDLISLLEEINHEYFVICTKSDKLNQKQLSFLKKNLKQNNIKHYLLVSVLSNSEKNCNKILEKLNSFLSIFNNK